MAGSSRNHFRGRGQPHYVPRHQSGGGGFDTVVGEGVKLSFLSPSLSSTLATTAKAPTSITATTTTTTTTTTHQQQLLARLRNSSISHPTQQIQLAIYVPPTSVGAIIGRGGKTILNIQREAMKRSLGHPGSVRINILGGNNASYFGGGGGGGGNNIAGDALLFGDGSTGSDSATAGKYNNDDTHDTYDNNYHGSSSNEDADNTDNNWTPVIIRGDPVGAFAAVRLILPLLNTADTNNNSSSSNNSNVINRFSASNEKSSSSCIHDGIVLDVPIHWSKHSLLVGQGGHTVAALSATYQTRIMIPPPHPSSERNENKKSASQQQPQNQHAQLPAGGGSSGAVISPTMPSNIIQLEGDDIDLVEQCLAKMISIVTGEELWVPKGKRIAVVNKENKQKTEDTTTADVVVEDDECDQILLAASTTSINQDTIIATTNSCRRKEEVGITTTTAYAPTAEAVIIKISTPSSKLLNFSKIRKIQRKTNTIIRRKKTRIVEGVDADGAGDNTVVNEDGNDQEVEELDDDEEDEEEESGGGGNSHEFPSTNKVATKYIISGNFENVKSATAQFETILGLEPGSSIIVHKPNKSKHKGTSLSLTRSSAAAAAAGGGGGDVNEPAGYDINNDTETENAKKARRKQKKGKKIG